MSTQYIVNEAGERVSVILPIAEYEALLRAAASEDKTAFLLQRIDDYRHGRNIIERELLPDEEISDPAAS